jgi:hypothetical protein
MPAPFPTLEKRKLCSYICETLKPMTSEKLPHVPQEKEYLHDT